jgi:pimeloyl-ACP methyl ester carboxylesterase
MEPTEVRALGELAGEAVGGLAARVGEMHSGVAGRVFKAVGPGAAPVQLIHDGIAVGVYAAVQTLSKVAARAGAGVLSLTVAPEAPSLERRVGGRVAIGVLNGAFGDELARRENPLALKMTVRSRGRDVPPTRSAISEAFPDAGGRVAVFLHGLCETDDAWRLAADRNTPYGDRLQFELGYAPVYIRYNSGRHISENGRELARLLAELSAAWPVQVTEIVLIGHSMGGLVARSGCYYGAGQQWVNAVRHVFTLAAPHLGAPLEQVTHAATAGLAMLPETRALASALNIRSAGIKDLRHGYLTDEDWVGHDPHAFLRREAREIPFLTTANHYFVSATVRGPAGLLIGDLLVLRGSAWAHRGRGQRLRFGPEHYRHLGGANHFALLNHPAIYEQIRAWLAPRPLLPAVTGS